VDIALPIIVAVAVFVVAMWAGPRGKRAAIAVPAVALFVALLLAARWGRDDLALQAKTATATAGTTASDGYTKDCKLARSLAENNLVAAGRRQLAAAIAEAPAKLPDEGADACASAQTTLAGLPATAADASDTSTPTTASVPSSDVSVADAVQHGVERGGAVVLDHLVGGSQTGSAQELTLGPIGWLLLALLLLLFVLGWARLNLWWRRRTSAPDVALVKVVDGDGKSDSVAAFGAELRQKLFEADLRSPSLQNSNIPDDVAGVVKQSGVSGAEFAASILTLLRHLFAPDNVVDVTITVKKPAPAAPGAPPATDPPAAPVTGAFTATIEMCDRQSGVTLGIKTPKPSDNQSELIQRVVVIVKDSALAQRGENLPAWQEWNEEALNAYLKADEIENLASLPAPAAVTA
jgi:hypothetical protein